MLRPRHALAVAFSLGLVAATSTGCDDETAATPQVIFTGRLQSSAIAQCNDRSELFTIGDFGNPNANPPKASRAIKDGEAFGQGNVSVKCNVVPVGGNEFQVEAAVDLSGATGGFFNIDGRFRTDGTQSSIHAKFGNRFTTNQYEQLDRGCTVRYLSEFQGVAAGRVWGEVTCPKAENVSAQTACEAIAEFRFENCGK